jgi:sigma-B regulation protein RsbU (phosphoserine phosphatase)
MLRANRRAKKDIKSGMFVALLYALLDSKERTVCLCSAGQTQPIHFSASIGKAGLVQTEGDTFPIGILDDVEYKETYLHLSSGDSLVFYTDGIVEAMNERQEIYGFDRLLDLVQGSGSLDAESLLKEIMKQVKEFVGEAPQSDDLTVIVIGVK